MSEFIAEFDTAKINDFSSDAKFQSTTKKIKKQNFDKTIFYKITKKVKNKNKLLETMTMYQVCTPEYAKNNISADALRGAD